jgi:hypothetical protein
MAAQTVLPDCATVMAGNELVTISVVAVLAQTLLVELTVYMVETDAVDTTFTPVVDDSPKGALQE